MLRRSDCSDCSSPDARLWSTPARVQALVDFPHSREFCVSRPFAPGKEAARCANCYCYVCDAPAAGCPEWDCDGWHCKATHSDAKWQALRAAWKAAGGKPPAAGAAASSSSGGGAGTGSDGFDDDEGGDAGYSYYGSRYGCVSRLSCDEFLLRIQQVYPREESEPNGFPSDLTLRPVRVSGHRTRQGLPNSATGSRQPAWQLELTSRALDLWLCSTSASRSPS